MKRKSISIILIVLLALLLLAIVIWMFDKKIETIEKKMSEPVTYASRFNFSPLKTFDHH